GPRREARGAAPGAPRRSSATRRGSRSRCARSKRPARLVASAPRTDPDERHAVGARDRAADGLRVEAEHRARANRNLLAVDAPEAVACDDDVHLFLLRARFVVLVADRAGWELEPVDPERLAPELPAHELDAAGGAGAFDLVDVHDAEAHAFSFHMRKIPNCVSG